VWSRCIRRGKNRGNQKKEKKTGEISRLGTQTEGKEKRSGGVVKRVYEGVGGENDSYSMEGDRTQRKAVKKGWILQNSKGGKVSLLAQDSIYEGGGSSRKKELKLIVEGRRKGFCGI